MNGAVSGKLKVALKYGLNKSYWRFCLRMKRFNLFEIFLIVAILGTHLYAAFSAPHNFSLHWFVRDDAYYYFKVAENVALGHGFTFDGINLTNGYHPLWLLICIPIFFFARFDLILPLRILIVVLALISAATSVLLYRLLRKAIWEPIAMVVSAFWAFNLYIHDIVIQNGLETGITALAIVLFLYLLQKFESHWRTEPVKLSQIAWLAVAALFVLFSRLDTIYLVLIAGIWLIFRRTPIRYLLLSDLFLTFAVIVSAYIQRAQVNIYLLAYANWAILVGAMTFTIQTIIFYFVGLYHHPRQESIRQLARDSLVGVTASAIIAGGLMLAFSLIPQVVVPRAVPFLYWIAMLILTFVSRLVVRFVSPWPVSPSNEMESPREQLRTNWQTWLREGSVYFGIVGGALGLYMLINKIAFGIPMPVSGEVKRWWGSLPHNVYGGGAKTLLDVFGIDPTYSKPWSLAMNHFVAWGNYINTHFLHSKSDMTDLIVGGITLLLITVLFLLRRKKSLGQAFSLGLIPFLIGTEFHAFGYGAMPYAAEQEWYWVMEMLAVLIVTALVIDSLLAWIPFRKMLYPLGLVAAAGISLYLAYGFWSYVHYLMPYKETNPNQPYMDMIPLIEDHTKPGAIVGMTGGGNVGYFIHDRTIVNLDGLINSNAYFQAMQKGQAGDYLEKMGLDYVFGNPYILTYTAPYRDQFIGHLQEMNNTPTYGRKQLVRFVPLHPTPQPKP